MADGPFTFFYHLCNAVSGEMQGIDAGLSNIYRLSEAKSRSISPENFNGEKGKGGTAEKGTGESAARDLGKGWKLSPSVQIKSHTTFTIAEINGSGSIQHIWMTPTGVWRNSIIRFYWDDEKTPSVEAPVGDQSPLQRTARRSRTAWAPSRVQRMPLWSQRSLTRWPQAPLTTPVPIGQPQAR